MISLIWKGTIFKCQKIPKPELTNKRAKARKEWGNIAKNKDQMNESDKSKGHQNKERRTQLQLLKWERHSNS
jgi:hypothetical protein